MKFTDSDDISFGQLKFTTGIGGADGAIRDQVDSGDRLFALK